MACRHNQGLCCLEVCMQHYNPSIAMGVATNHKRLMSPNPRTCEAGNLHIQIVHQGTKASQKNYRLIILLLSFQQ